MTRDETSATLCKLVALTWQKVYSMHVREAPFATHRFLLIQNEFG